MLFTERNFDVVDALRSVADEVGRSMAEVALAWVASRPGVSSVLIGASRPEQMMAMLDTNALGALRVPQAFPPFLRRSKAARVVMMSSSLGSLSATAALGTGVWNVDFAGYCASKATLNMLTLKLAKDLMGEGIKVNAADPGRRPPT